MRSDTKSIFIQADTSKVMRFLADPTNLPKWAVAFAQSVRREGDRWVVATAGGEMGLRMSRTPVSASSTTTCLRLLVSKLWLVHVSSPMRTAPNMSLRSFRGLECQMTCSTPAFRRLRMN